MKKLEKRAIICLTLAAALVLGTCVFIAEFFINGSTWAAYPTNKHIYSNGKLTTGTIYDRNGLVLAQNTPDGVEYNEDSGIRRATVHVVGDAEGNVGLGAQTAFSDKLVGYNVITGTYNTTGKGRSLYLTIDAKTCEAANEALAGRKGLVAVYNYKTGEVLCMVSSPNFDPEKTPSSSSSESGLFMNKFYSATVVPGSIFKLVTTAAVIENKSNLDTWSYHCTGQIKYGNDVIKCTEAHGSEDFYGALANSCNCAFATLSQDIGEDTLEKYVKQLKLDKSMDINGIKTAAGTFDFPGDDVNLGWTGIGQYHDLINPCSYLTYVGAIAGGGEAAEPRVIKSLKYDIGLPAGAFKKTKTGQLIEESTADMLADMMRNNVEETYGKSKFPGLDICAKSGTAQVGKGNKPHAWFTGFLEDEDHPYAFIVLVEHGGWGSTTAGSVANKVLQAAVKNN